MMKIKIIRILIACGILGCLLLFGFLLNRVDSLQQSVNLLNNNVVDLSWTVNEIMPHRFDNQQAMIDQQRNEIIRINSLNNKRCTWQSPLHNPSLVNKYSISVDIIDKKAGAGDGQGSKWTSICDWTSVGWFPKDAIVYLKTLKSLDDDSTYLIDVSILNNSSDDVEEYQQTVFSYPQDAINYLENLESCEGN